MKLAAIDIGSNAIRFQVSHVLEYQGHTIFKKLEYVRFPLRLGHDVFTLGHITPPNEAKLVSLLKAYAILLQLYEVESLMACATSAFREAANGTEVAKRVREETGIEIQIIEGKTEADLIDKTLINYIRDDQSYLHIDVGGGSTELNYYRKGSKINSESFRLGSVRLLENKAEPEEWDRLKNWVRSNCSSAQKLTAVGTGGNINKIFELSQNKEGTFLSLSKIKEIQSELRRKALDERMFEWQLNPDRADVIVPASEIYTSVMKWANIKKMQVPELGLKDGIILSLYEKLTAKKV